MTDQLPEPNPAQRLENQPSRRAVANSLLHFKTDSIVQENGGRHVIAIFVNREIVLCLSLLSCLESLLACRH